MNDETITAESLKAAIGAVRMAGDDVEIAVRIENTSKRALHYIADVRAIRYDPGTRTLTVSLSDEGREVIPSMVGKIPAFQYVDPESEAEIVLRIPNRVVKLSKSGPPGELVFETHSVSDVEEIIVEMAWADGPLYRDRRIKPGSLEYPTVTWQQHKASARRRLKGELRPKS